MWPYGAVVARLTPDQKAGCSSHSGVMYNFSIFIFRDYFLRLRTSLVYNWVYCIVIHTFSNQILVEATFMYVSYSCSFLVILTSRFYGVMVSTLDFESSDPSSNLGRTFSLPLKIHFLTYSKTPWRNGSASDSRSEGCVFESRRGQKCFCLYLSNIIKNFNFLEK